jgi:hypothetical protein
MVSRITVGALVGAAVGFALGATFLTTGPEFKILGSVAGAILGAVAGELDRRHGRQGDQPEKNEKPGITQNSRLQVKKSRLPLARLPRLSSSTVSS